MALVVYNTSGGGILAARPCHPPPPPRLRYSQTHHIIVYSDSCRRSTHVARARKGPSPRTRDKKGAVTTSTTTTGGEGKRAGAAAAEEEEGEDEAVEGYAWPPPELPGEQPDFWEGPQWNVLGFFVQYQWAFGIAFALIACGIAVATYNEGATDFKQTTVYKESIQSRELLEGPDASNSDVFEANPTEEAPSLE